MSVNGRPGSAVAILTIAFCLWHMTAVAAYLLPPDKDALYGNIQQLTVPYVRLLSQWQKWDIFSPNPLRRNSVYRIERDAGDRWETAMILDFEHLRWYERSKELKVLGRLQDSWSVLLPNYLLSLCPRIPDVQGTEVRLVVDRTILPRELAALKENATTPNLPSKTELSSVRCPRI